MRVMLVSPLLPNSLPPERVSAPNDAVPRPPLSMSSDSQEPTAGDEPRELPVVAAKPLTVAGGSMSEITDVSESEDVSRRDSFGAFGGDLSGSLGSERSGSPGHRSSKNIRTSIARMRHEVSNSISTGVSAGEERASHAIDHTRHLRASMVGQANSVLMALRHTKTEAPQDFDNMIEQMWAGQAAQYHKASSSIQRQLRLHERGIISPRTSKWMPYWDFMSFVCLFFTAIFTPIEVCFVENAGPVWFTLNWIVNVFFICDLVLNFFLAFQETNRKGGGWVTDRKRIIKHYVRTWFSIDLLTVIDFQIIARAVLASQPGGTTFCIYCQDEDSDDGDDSTDALRLVRTVRLLRLVKLLRILRASRIIQRWQDFFGFTYAQLTLFKLLTSLFMLLHWYSCIWSYTALEWNKSSDALAFETTWIDGMNMTQWVDDNEMQRIYLVALYVSLIAMFGGIGTIGPYNLTEYAVLTFILFTGCFFWAYVISSLCSMLATLNPHTTAFRNTMDELNHFMDDHQFGTDHRVRIRRFFRSTQDFTRQSSYKYLLGKMSERLRGDTALLIGVSVMRRVWYFDLRSFDIEKDFLAHIALAMERHIFEAKERFKLSDLTVLVGGTLCVGLRIVLKGCVLGQDCLIRREHERLRENAQALAACLTVVETTTISREAILLTAENFPKAKMHLQWVIRRLTFRAAVKRVIQGLNEEKMQLRNATFNLSSWRDRVADAKAAEEPNSASRANPIGFLQHRLGVNRATSQEEAQQRLKRAVSLSRLNITLAAPEPSDAVPMTAPVPGSQPPLTAPSSSGSRGTRADRWSNAALAQACAVDSDAAVGTNGSGGGGTCEIGERLRHPGRGLGRVVEHMEDGRVKVAFESGEEHRYKPASLHKLTRDDGTSVGTPTLGRRRLDLKDASRNMRMAASWKHLDATLARDADERPGSDTIFRTKDSSSVLLNDDFNFKLLREMSELKREVSSSRDVQKHTERRLEERMASLEEALEKGLEKISAAQEHLMDTVSMRGF